MSAGTLWHLGCGAQPEPLTFGRTDAYEIVNIDIRPDLPVEHEVADVRDLAQVAARRGRPAAIAAEDILEHLPYDDAVAAVRHWCGLLLDGGTIHIRVPDIYGIARELVDGTLPFGEIMRRLYGGHDYPENVHHCGFDPGGLAQLLEDQDCTVTKTSTQNFNLLVSAKKGQAGGPMATDSSKRVLITTPWTAQGLTTLSVYLGRTLESLGCTVDYHAWRHPDEDAPRYAPPGWPEDGRVQTEPFEELDLSNHNMIVWPEVVERAQVDRCNAAGLKTVWIPMWEYVGKPHPKDVWADWDVIVCPHQGCFELLQRAVHTESPVIAHCPWWCDLPIREPRATPDVPTFLHCVRGVTGDLRSNTETVLRAWEAFIGTAGRGRLIVKTIMPLASFVRDAELLTRSPSVTVYEGAWPRPRLEALYDSADVFISVTRREGLGLFLLEALMAGLPVITTDAPPMNEWVEHGTNGLLVPVVLEREDGNVPLVSVSVEGLRTAISAMMPQDIEDMKRHLTAAAESRREPFTDFCSNLVARVPVPATESADNTAHESPVAPVAQPARARPGASITIVTATHNRIDLTQRTIHSVKENTEANFRWIIVDDASTDGTVAMLKTMAREDSRIEWMGLDKRSGKAAALNLAMRRIDTPWWITLDNDILVPPGWWKPLISTLKVAPDLGIVALSCEEAHYPEVFINRTATVCLKPVGAVNGACQAARKELIERIGYHSVAYGTGGYVDWEWCLRARLSGLGLAYAASRSDGTSNAGIEHIGADKAAIDQPDRERAGRLWYKRAAAFVSGALPLYIGPNGQDEGPQLEGVE